MFWLIVKFVGLILLSAMVFAVVEAIVEARYDTKKLDELEKELTRRHIERNNP